MPWSASRAHSSAGRWPPRRRCGERLSKKKALAIFSSDAISSSAYATEEILHVLVVAGAVGPGLSLNVAIAIALMLAVVSTSYRQIGYAYPSGGGAYAVVQGQPRALAALIAAAALLVDYILTVAVSHLVGRAADHLGPARPDAARRARSASCAIALITLGNLRGLRESGQHLRHPDLPVRGRRAADDRRSARTGSSCWATARPPPSSSSRGAVHATVSR